MAHDCWARRVTVIQIVTSHAQVQVRDKPPRQNSLRLIYIKATRRHLREFTLRRDGHGLAGQPAERWESALTVQPEKYPIAPLFGIDDSGDGTVRRAPVLGTTSMPLCIRLNINIRTNQNPNERRGQSSMRER